MPPLPPSPQLLTRVRTLLNMAPYIEYWPGTIRARAPHAACAGRRTSTQTAMLRFVSSSMPVCLFVCLFVCIACRNARDLNNYFFSSLTYPFLTTTRRALQYEGARTLCKHYVEKHYHQQAGSVSMRHGARLVSVTRCHRWRAPIPMTRDKGALISVPISLSRAHALSLSLSLGRTLLRNTC